MGGKECKGGSSGAPGEQTRGSEISVPHSLLIPGTELARLQSSERTAGQAPSPFSDRLRQARPPSSAPVPGGGSGEASVSRLGIHIFFKLRRMKGTL